MSSSVVDSASTYFDGAIWLISGTSVATPPTPAAVTAAILMKSRRRTPSPAASASGSAVPVVIAIALPCLPAPWAAARTRNRRNSGPAATLPRPPGARLGGADRRADRACQQAFWALSGGSTGQSDQRELAPVGRLAAVRGAAVGEEAGLAGIRVEPEAVDRADP